MARAKRWSPGKGFVKLQEYGSIAVWMKALKDGALLAAYRPCWREGQEHLVEKWIIQLPRGTDFHWDILDKIGRIHWLLDDKKPEPGSALWNVKILKYEVAGASHVERRAQPCRRSWGSWTRGDKHFWTWRRVRPWEGQWGTEHRGTLPRKIAAALRPGLTELRALQAYRKQLFAQWAQWEADRLQAEVTDGQHDAPEATAAEVVSLYRALR